MARGRTPGEGVGLRERGVHDSTGASEVGKSSRQKAGVPGESTKTHSMNRRRFFRDVSTAMFGLMLALPGAAESKDPRFFKTAKERLGSVLLLSYEGGEAEAETLQGLGFDTVLVHPEHLARLTRMAPWARRQLGERYAIVSLGEAAGLASRLVKPHVSALVLVEPDPLPASLAPGLPPVLILVREQLPTGLEPAEVKLAPSGVAGLTREDDPVQKNVRRFVQAHSGVAPRGLAGVGFVQSPNWDVRSARGGIDTVVVHATVINTMEGTQRAFLDDKVRRVSAHYVVDRDGTIVQMVDERVAAWHAGVSELEGRTGVNDFSIGVELINLNDGVDPYPDAQVAALARIIKDLRTRWTIPDSRIVSHAQIARPEGRKSDPLGFDFVKLGRLLR